MVKASVIYSSTPMKTLGHAGIINARLNHPPCVSYGRSSVFFPGLLTICGELTSRYPITASSFLSFPDKVRCIAFICTAGHVRRSVLSHPGRVVRFEKLSRFYYFLLGDAPLWICIVTLYIWYTWKWRRGSLQRSFFPCVIFFFFIFFIFMF